MSDNFKFSVTNGYSSSNNYEYTVLCNLVYKDESKIYSQVNSWKTKIPDLNCIVKTIEQPIFANENKIIEVFFERTSRFMVLYNNDFIIVVFRGSSNYDDWIKNFEAVKTNFKEGKGKVHLGFYRTVKNMRNHIDTVINEVRTNNQKIYVTGHSLGGAQALLASFMCDSLKDFETITTFGQPRVGNKEFSEWVNTQILRDSYKESKYFRVVNKNDPVPMVPFLEMKFVHCGNFYINCEKLKHYNIITEIENIEFIKKIKIDELSIKKLKIEEKSIKDFKIEKLLLHITNHLMVLYISNARLNYKFNPFKLK